MDNLLKPSIQKEIETWDKYDVGKDSTVLLSTEGNILTKKYGRVTKERLEQYHRIHSHVSKIVKKNHYFYGDSAISVLDLGTIPIYRHTDGDLVTFPPYIAGKSLGLLELTTLKNDEAGKREINEQMLFIRSVLYDIGLKYIPEGGEGLVGISPNNVKSSISNQNLVVTDLGNSIMDFVILNEGILNDTI